MIDQTEPRAYKPIDAVLHARRELIDVVHELRLVLYVKGWVSNPRARIGTICTSFRVLCHTQSEALLFTFCMSPSVESADSR